MTSTLTKNSRKSSGLAAAAIAASAEISVPDRLVDETEAADILGVKRQTLSVWRINGRGPAFHKIGRLVKYKLSALASYVDSRCCNNTAEADALND